MNPGPDTINSSLSILHSNIRSIRNKLDYITENFLDFDILSFTESHLDANITTESLIMSSKYDRSNESWWRAVNVFVLWTCTYSNDRFGDILG